MIVLAPNAPPGKILHLSQQHASVRWLFMGFGRAKKSQRFWCERTFRPVSSGPKQFGSRDMQTGSEDCRKCRKSISFCRYPILQILLGTFHVSKTQILTICIISKYYYLFLGGGGSRWVALSWSAHCPGPRMRIPRPAGRYNPSIVFWVFPGVSYQLDVPGKNI